MLQVNPRVIVDASARNGGHWFPIAETFNNGSITALAYGTDRSKISVKVDPHKLYNCGCLMTGITSRTKSILTTFSSIKTGVALTKETFMFTLTAEQRCDSIRFSVS